jgi:hypothetical protein
MNGRYSERLRAFRAYWREKSDIGPIECMMLEIYDDWLIDYEKNEATTKDLLYRL